MKKILIILLSLFMICGCTEEKSSQNENVFPLDEEYDDTSVPIEEESDQTENIFSLDEEYYGNAGLIAIESLEELAGMEEEEKSFALYVYMPGCTTCAAFKPIFNSFIEKYGITAYSISSAVIGDSKENSVMKTITYAPSVLLYDKGVPVASLDAMSNDDAPYYKTAAAFKEWWEQYCTLENAQ